MAGYLPGRLPWPRSRRITARRSTRADSHPLFNMAAICSLFHSCYSDIHPMIGSHACTMPLFCSFHEYLQIYISIRS